MNACPASQRRPFTGLFKGSVGEQPHFSALCAMDARSLCWLLCALVPPQGHWALPLHSRHGGSLAFSHSGPADPDRDQYPAAGVADPPQPLARQCQHMSQPWASGPHTPGLQEDSAPWRLRVQTAVSGPPKRPIFPHLPLFHYIKRIYSCCKQGSACRKVRGLQGRVALDGPLRDLEFYVDSGTLELTLERAELHLEVSNPDRVTVVPVLACPGFSSSSHTELTRVNVSDLTLDVMFLFDMLRADRRATADGAAELTLNLHCFHEHVSVPCDHHGVGILRAPFIALLYK